MPPGARLTSMASISQYATSLRHGASAVGLAPRWTPRCPRAGRATEARLAGQPFSTIREQGRWTSDRSSHVYLDTMSA
eukprot:6141234-Alexandrium_andersonii.AAC.1